MPGEKGEADAPQSLAVSGPSRKVTGKGSVVTAHQCRPSLAGLSYSGLSRAPTPDAGHWRTWRATAVHLLGLRKSGPGRVGSGRRLESIEDKAWREERTA